MFAYVRLCSPMFEKRKELEMRVEKLRLEEQLTVARVREGVFAEIESGVSDANLTVRQVLPSKSSSVQGSNFSGPFLLQPSRRTL